MAHDHSHAHDHSSADAQTRVASAAILTFAFMCVEVVGGLLSGSLALLADAVHMLTDAGSLALAWLGYRLAEKPADPTRSYGMARFRILAAFVNGLALIVLAAWIIVEAVQRLAEPQPVLGGILLWVALGGLVVNCVAFAILHGGDRDDLNLSGALWHVAGDLLGSVAAIAAAIVILTTGWTPIDPILSMLVAALVAWAGVGIARKSGHILLEGAPEGMSAAAIITDLETAVDGAASVHHVHAWQLTERRPMITLEVTAEPGVCPEQLRRAVKARLAAVFNVSHATVEVVSEPRENAPAG